MLLGEDGCGICPEPLPNSFHPESLGAACHSQIPVGEDQDSHEFLWEKENKPHTLAPSLFCSSLLSGPGLRGPTSCSQEPGDTQTLGSQIPQERGMGSCKPSHQRPGSSGHSFLRLSHLRLGLCENAKALGQTNVGSNSLT